MTPSPQQLGLVVVAAGSGARFGAMKQFAPLAGKPLLAHCLETFDRCGEFVDRVVVLPGDMLESAAWRKIRDRLENPVRPVAGGVTRADSVRAGVEALDTRCELVAVHDGARPFVPVDAMRECLARLREDATLAAAIVASPIADTLKSTTADQTIERTIDRARTVRAETPQLCRRALLLAALADARESVTDEAQALERAGHRTAAVLHDGYNVKITNTTDLVLAEAWLRHMAAHDDSKPCYLGEIDA